jgi:nitrate/TMAO reductase-like tetraheme cytochrome c subunit
MRSRWILAAALALASGSAIADGLKNLQVLPRSTTKDEIKQIMKAQAKALDVECDHCHNVPDMASDDNPNKKIARDMMKMTAEINAKWIKPLKNAEKNQVTCATCHRGHEEPPPFTGK